MFYFLVTFLSNVFFLDCLALVKITHKFGVSFIMPHRLCCAPQAMLCPSGYAVLYRLCCALQAMLCSTGYAVLRRLCCAPQAMLCPTGYAVPCRLFCALQAICSRVIMFLLCLIDCPACLGGAVGSVTLCAAWLR